MVKETPFAIFSNINFGCRIARFYRLSTHKEINAVEISSLVSCSCWVLTTRSKITVLCQNQGSLSRDPVCSASSELGTLITILVSEGINADGDVLYSLITNIRRRKAT